MIVVSRHEGMLTVRRFLFIHRSETVRDDSRLMNDSMKPEIGVSQTSSACSQKKKKKDPVHNEFGTFV